MVKTVPTKFHPLLLHVVRATNYALKNTFKIMIELPHTSTIKPEFCHNIWQSIVRPKFYQAFLENNWITKQKSQSLTSCCS